MMQLSMFDLKGKPTSHAMRYVLPRYYSVEWFDKNGYRRKSITPDVHVAIQRWLKCSKPIFKTHW